MKRAEAIGGSVTGNQPAYGPDRQGAWRAVAVLLIFYVLSIADRQMIALMVGALKSSLSLTDLQLGLLQGLAFTLIYSFAGLPIGWMVDRFDRRRLLACGILIWSGATIASGLATSFATLFAARTLVGVGEAVLLPVAFSLIADLFARERLSFANAVFMAGSGIGGGLALVSSGSLMALLGGQAVSRLPLVGVLEPWRGAFLVCGAAGVAAVALVWLIPDPRNSAGLPRDTRPEMQQPDGGFAAFLGANWRLVAHHFTGFVLIGTAVFSYAAWTPHFLMAVHGWSIERTALVMGAIVGICTTAGIVLGGIIIARLMGKGRLTAHFDVPLAATMAGMPFMAAAYFMPTPTLLALLLGFGAFLFCFYGSAAFSAIQLIAPPTMRGRLAACYVAALGIVGGGLGPLAAPLLARLNGNTSGAPGHEIAWSIVVLTLAASLAFATGRRSLAAAVIAAQSATEAHQSALR